MGIKARAPHEATNWFTLTNCSNAFSTVNRTGLLAEEATCVPVLTLFLPKFYHKRLADALFRMD